MNSGVIQARHYVTGEPVEVQWENGVIQSITSLAQQPPPDRWVAPALVDLQVNGFGGINFQQDNLSVDDLRAARRSLLAAGCTRWLLTLITDEWPALVARLRHLRALRESSPELRRAIVGWHVEGPFLSGEPGFCGAHNPALMLDPSPEHIRQLREVTGDDPLLLTLAPERPGALEAIEQATTLGIKISLGHTNASADVIAQSIARGATGFTHLGNACPRELDRHDNILWRVLETEGLHVSLIPDAIHVSPALFRLVHKLRPRGSIYYTADAMSAAGMPPGRYQLSRLELEVGADRIVRQPGRTNFAGSALRPLDGVFRAAEMLGCSWRETWARFSDAPSAFMGLPGGLAVGQRADFCVLDIGEENELKELQLFTAGVS